MFKSSLEQEPFSLVYTLYDYEQYGIEVSDGDKTLGVMDYDSYVESYERSEQELDELNNFDRNRLSTERQHTYDTLVWLYDTDLEFKDGYYMQRAIGAGSGFICNLVTNFTEYCFRREQDVKDYFLYMESIPPYYESYIKFCNEQAEKGLFVNDDVIEQNIEYCDKMLDTDAKVYIDTFESRIKSLDLSDSDKEAYIEKTKNMCRSMLYLCIRIQSLHLKIYWEQARMKEEWQVSEKKERNIMKQLSVIRQVPICQQKKLLSISMQK